MSLSDKSGTQAIQVVLGQNLVQLEAIDLQVVAGPDAGRQASFSLPNSLVIQCANIAGEWSISENVTMNRTISERTTSQSLSVAGTSINM